MSDSRISKKILSEICGHDIWNVNSGSIGNLWKFAILESCAPLSSGAVACD